MMDREINNQLKPIILKNIKRIRAINGISEDYMRLRIGISQGQYCKIEGGQTKNLYKYLDRLAAILEIGVLELAIPYSENKKENKGHLSSLEDYLPVSHEDYMNVKKLDSYKNFIIANGEILANEMASLKVELSNEQNHRVAAEIRIKELEAKLGINL